MGCGGSKMDDLEAVSLCRERCQLLESAIRHRYALSQAHLSYLHSLKSVAFSLQRFYELDSIPPSSSPLLPIPNSPKKPPPIISSASAAHALDHNDDSGHLQFHSDSDSDAADTFAPVRSSPPRFYANYARSSVPAPSLAFEQRPPNLVQYADTSSYPAYPGFSSFFGSPPPPSYSSYPQYAPPSTIPPEPPRSNTASAPAPPPPPPPSGSAWDFLNPFESSAQYYPPYTPSRDSHEVREEEGIPDLEDEDDQHEVVKEVDVAAEGSGGGGGGKVVFGGNLSGVASSSSSAGAGEMSGVAYDVHLVDKKVVETKEEVPAESRGNVQAFKTRGPMGVAEIVGEIKMWFDRASESGGEVAKILEVGKLPYRGKNAIYKVSSKMLDVMTPLPARSSYSSALKAAEALLSTEMSESLSVDFEEDMRMKSKSLSSTLEKLYIWEKKLYEEVKIEEKMRVVLERKCRRLKHLDERGAEARKIEATRMMVRDLSSKIRIALHFVDSIANRISKLRDEDLWPQIDLLIQGFVKMWKVMLECHQNQCQIVMDAKKLDSVASGRKLSEAHMEATLQLEQDLLNWILSFYAWISAQKSYIKALNGWLKKCIIEEDERTDDGVMPFSPGRVGAPPVFVICNHWSQVMDRISEHEVFGAMQSFSLIVLHLWDKYNMEQRQRMLGNKDMDRQLKVLERDEHNMQKALDIVNKKLAVVSEQNGLPPPGQIVHQSHSGSANVSLHLGLKQIFEAMERFSDVCMNAYEELHHRTEEDRHSRESAKVP